VAGFSQVHLVRWSAPLVALCLAVAACSDDGPSVVPADPTGTAALPSVPRDSESSGNEVRVAVPPPSAALTTEPAQSLSRIERPGTAPRLVVTGPGLTDGRSVEVLAPAELMDGLLVFIEEVPGSLAGNTLTITDDSFEVLATLETPETPFVDPTGWPNTAIIRQTEGFLVFDAASGRLTPIDPTDGGELWVLELPAGRRYVPVLEIGGANATFVLDLAEHVLIPTPGSVRMGPPVFSPDGRWIIVVPEIEKGGATALEIVRPDAPSETAVRIESLPDELLSDWFFDPAGGLWVTSRPEGHTSLRLVHHVDLASGVASTWYEWNADIGFRLVAVAADRHVVEDFGTRDHYVVDTSGDVVSWIPSPPEAPRLFGDTAAYIDENAVVLVDLVSGEIQWLRAIGSPTPSEVDFVDVGQYWIADGYAPGEIGLFRLDFARQELVDHRAAVADLPDGVHFFSFDPTRFAADGSALVAYEGEAGSWVVHLRPDATASVLELPSGHSSVDITLSPTGDRAILLSGDRSPERRESIASMLDLTTMTSEDHDRRLMGQRLAVWLVR